MKPTKSYCAGCLGEPLSTTPILGCLHCSPYKCCGGGGTQGGLFLCGQSWLLWAFCPGHAVKPLRVYPVPPEAPRCCLGWAPSPHLQHWLFLARWSLCHCGGAFSCRPAGWPPTHSAQTPALSPAGCPRLQSLPTLCRRRSPAVCPSPSPCAWNSPTRETPRFFLRRICPFYSVHVGLLGDLH